MPYSQIQCCRAHIPNHFQSEGRHGYFKPRGSRSYIGWLQGENGGIGSQNEHIGSRSTWRPNNDVQDGWGPLADPSGIRAKAVASASFEVASGALTDNSQAPIFRAFMAMEGGHMIPGQGALPVFRNGEIIGAVGGSGGTAQEDEDCARAGIEAAGFSASR